MASNPPFEVEDTDEDFFDKLVNDDDDDDYKVTPLSSVVGTDLADGHDSDDAKAFANLDISDVGTQLEDLGKVSIVDEQEEEDIKASSSINGDVKDESTDTRHPLVTSSSFAFDSLNKESNPAETGFEDPDSLNHGSGDAPGVKEVQWSAFNTDLAESVNNGFGSYPDFFTAFGDNNLVDQIGKEGNLVSREQNIASGSSSVVDNSLNMGNINVCSHQFQEVQAPSASGEQNIDGQDPDSSQYWENLYPGWKYDASTGQWYPVNEGYDATEGAHNLNSANEKPEVSYLQQTVQSTEGAVAEKGTTESVTSWNSVSQMSHTNENLSNWDQGSQEHNGYPSYMVFDPQYPGWYYDMNAQEWRSLDSYNSQSNVQASDQVSQNGFLATNNTYYGNDHGRQDQFDKQSGPEVFSSQRQDYKWNGSFSNVEQERLTMWQPDNVAKSAPMSDLRGNQQAQNHNGTNFRLDKHVNQQQSYDYGAVSSFKVSSQIGAQSFVPSGNFNQSTIEQSEMMNVPKAYSNQNQSIFSQQPVQSGWQVSYASSSGRSSAGRPPHALVTFGFGGKLIVMKDSTALIKASYGSQDSNGGSISVLNLAEVFTGGADAPSGGAGVFDYFDTLGRQSFPGPLAGGNIGGKELNKWIDERIIHSESPNMDYRNSEVLKLLLSLLKIASQHYGKLRSSFGTDTTSKETDAPEVAVARLFASARKNRAEYSDYGAFTHCLQKLPSEAQTQVTAAEVQTLLVSGRKMEALHCAQEGQLWGPALVLAAQLGDQFYVDTVRKMALRQLVAGSPLRTLCLLIAGQPADAFSTDTTTDGGFPGAINMSQQPAQAQPGANYMLDDWEENLAMITANRTKDDELVLIHLGDSLWKERSNIIAAHICYLVAEANFEPYSDSARLCLIGADHWKQPRTYASPEAIQRTEVYEYTKLLGNSQFTLLPFQPYKIIYAHMLAEVGRVSDSLKYCQAISKSLKTGRAPEVETWRRLASSLEDRIKTHQQGGFSTNLAPGKLVGKLFNLIDTTAHRVVGGLPPSVPPTSGGNTQNNHHHHHQQQQQAAGPRVLTSQSTMAMSSLVSSASMEPIIDATAHRVVGGLPPSVPPTSGGNTQNNHHHHHQQQQQEAGPRVLTSQSTMAMSSLVPSASMEPMNQWSDEGDDKKIIQNRSVSEPDFGRSPRQVDSSKETSADSQNKASGGTSRFGRFGFGSQLFQKTLGLVLKPRGDKQAKLGDANKFYYDEKLKRWVEEGADPPAEEAAPPPPPTMASFQNGTSDYNINSALKTEGPHSNGTSEFTSPNSTGRNSGIPPIPATSNQFSARGRIGVRARYVDTFNQGGSNPTNLFQSPPAPTIKPATTNPNPKFFMPTSTPSVEQPVDTIPDNTQQPITEGDIKENLSFPSQNNSFQSPPNPPLSMSMQKYASMNNVSEARSANHAMPSGTRRTASWSGNQQGFSFSGRGEEPSLFMPSDSSSIKDDLQEVDL